MDATDLPAAADVRELRLWYADNYVAAIPHRQALDWLELLESALDALEQLTVAPPPCDDGRARGTVIDETPSPR